MYLIDRLISQALSPLPIPIRHYIQDCIHRYRFDQLHKILQVKIWGIRREIDYRSYSNSNYNGAGYDFHHRYETAGNNITAKQPFRQPYYLTEHFMIYVIRCLNTRPRQTKYRILRDVDGSWNLINFYL